MAAREEVKKAVDRCLGEFDWKKVEEVCRRFQLNTPFEQTGMMLLDKCMGRYLQERKSVIEYSDHLRAAVVEYQHLGRTMAYVYLALEVGGIEPVAFSVEIK